MLLTSTDRAAISTSPLFSAVSLDLIRVELESASIIELAPAEVLLKPGQQNSSIFVVLTGRLNICLDELSNQPVAQIAVGDCVGELSIIDDSPVSAFVVAHAATRVLAIKQQTLWNIMEVALGVALNLLNILSKRIRHDNRVIMNTLQLQRQFEQRASVDGLTGLHNRRWMDEMFARQLDRCSQGELQATLIMVDIDHFKNFNDSHGHLAGDHAICAVARVLNDQLRPCDLYARYGGEEFAILLPSTKLESGIAVAERLRKAVSSMPIVMTGGANLPSVTISLGLAQTAKSTDLTALILEADAALYRAKERGRNRVER